MSCILKRVGLLAIAVCSAGIVDRARAQSNPPATLEEAAAIVKKTKTNGASNMEVAKQVMEMVDRRITNGNDWDLSGSEYDQAIKTEAGKAKIKQANAEREQFGVGLGKHYGMEYALRSEWSWNLGYGNCNETSSIAYRILKDAGFTNIKMLETGANGGHAFVVLGMDPNGDSGDPATWGKDAFVVDPWRHQVLNCDEAAKNDWITGGGKHKPGDVTANYDDPKMYDFFKKKFVKKHYTNKLEEALAIKKAIEELDAPRKVTRDFTKEEVGEALKSLGFEPTIIEGNGIVRISAFKSPAGGLKPGEKQTIIRITLYRNKKTAVDYHQEKVSTNGNSTIAPADWGRMKTDGATLPGRKGDFPDQEFFPIGTAEQELIYQNLYIQAMCQKAGGRDWEGSGELQEGTGRGCQVERYGPRPGNGPCQESVACVGKERSQLD